MHLILIREIKLHSIRDRTLVADYSSQEALIHYTKRFNHCKKHAVTTKIVIYVI